ncbi:major facilitator family transporter [Klebsiella pneumoniae]|uniref:Major facilitator family transporter n=1 Tax=Klebsiella pneumoniae TaxID=573 RepID=A0A2X3CSL0_KLEPN|nr:major facilitator family transporter [Klebsiella pneumoniae]
MTYRHRVATVFLFGFFLDLINMFIASIAFPAISRALAVSVSQLAWVSNAYILGLTVVVPFSAWLSERWGGETAVFTLAGAVQPRRAGGRTCQQPERTDFMADAAGDGRRAVNPPRPGADVAVVSAA